MADTRTDLLVKMACRAHDAIESAIRASGDFAAHPAANSLMLARNELAAALAEWSVIECSGCRMMFPDTALLKVKIITALPIDGAQRAPDEIDVKQKRMCSECLKRAAGRGELVVTPLRRAQDNS